VVRGVDGAVDDGLHRGHVLVIEEDGDALERLGLEALQFAADVAENLRVQIFDI
jgi:hypothetical protein